MINIDIKPRFRIPKTLLQPAYSIEVVSMLYGISGGDIWRMFNNKVIEAVIDEETGEKLIPAKYIYKKDGEKIDTRDFELIMNITFESKSLFVDFISCYRYRFGKEEPLSYKNLKKLTIEDLTKCASSGTKKVSRIITKLITVIRDYSNDYKGVKWGIYG